MKVFRNLTEGKKKEDQRVERTRDRLGDALVELLLEKPFAAITVQEILDRAGVSRTTFYSHYRDKNDLFLSDAEEFFEAMATALSRFGDKSQRVAPVEELFSHIGERRDFYSALLESGRLRDVLELGQEHFARGITQRLAEMARSRAIAPNERDAIAHGLAGNLFSLLSWWIHHGMNPAAAAMDQLFHKQLWSGIDGGQARAT
ncbi:MAG TPA: TetR/AcrR family transcriptional regulator [Chthoniobacterales bacterium]|jgi:AcrR family transcriptional regulator